VNKKVRKGEPGSPDLYQMISPTRSSQRDQGVFGSSIDSSIRTSRQKTPRHTHTPNERKRKTNAAAADVRAVRTLTAREVEANRHKRLLAKLLRAVMTEEQFDSFADAREALKQRCADEGIRYDGDVVDQAIALVDSNTTLLTNSRKRRLHA
jgi:hypothetical protein